MTSTLTFQDVSYSYLGGAAALKNVSFRIQAGERVALLGPNGAGKSTVMLLACGVLLPAAGEIHVDDLLLAPSSLTAVRQRVGLVFQDPDDQLFMTTVFDDIAFGPQNSGISGEDLVARVHEALIAVGLADDTKSIASIAAKAPQQLSFGQRKRAALATVLVMQPQLYVLDEPSSNLDPHGRRQMQALLSSITDTTLIATHDLDLVWDICSRSIIIDAGEVIADGSTKELLGNEDLLEAHGLELPAAVRYQRQYLRACN
ncbi:MAG: energy-coupling factor ABC transporter ATP-binding protein [Coriobacteriia bacterium]|nr:energy-coupling factor ABC transporter ATP-binding protein [Coriobacteriia bacterium]